MQLVRKFSLSLPTTQIDQMPLSDILSASTSNALYWTKIGIENNSATQPVKETVVDTPAHAWLSLPDATSREYQEIQARDQLSSRTLPS